MGSFELTPGEIVWPRNDYPVIDSFAVEPAEPDTNTAITATAVASDPDGDELSYAMDAGRFRHRLERRP